MAISNACYATLQETLKSSAHALESECISCFLSIYKYNHSPK